MVRRVFAPRAFSIPDRSTPFLAPTSPFLSVSTTSPKAEGGKQSEHLAELWIYTFMILSLRSLRRMSRVSGQIGFFAHNSTHNILGRSVAFSAFQIGFHDSAEMIYLLPE
jgi:hypothetical protein